MWLSLGSRQILFQYGFLVAFHVSTFIGKVMGCSMVSIRAKYALLVPQRWDARLGDVPKGAQIGLGERQLFSVCIFACFTWVYFR